MRLSIIVMDNAKKTPVTYSHTHMGWGVWWPHSMCEEGGNQCLIDVFLRPSSAGKVKVATQKLQIFILATSIGKNTPTILFILLFISLKYYFLILFYCFIFFLFLPSPSPTTGQPHQTHNQTSKTTLAHPHPRPFSGPAAPCTGGIGAVQHHTHPQPVGGPPVLEVS